MNGKTELKRYARYLECILNSVSCTSSRQEKDLAKSSKLANIKPCDVLDIINSLMQLKKPRKIKLVGTSVQNFVITK